MDYLSTKADSTNRLCNKSLRTLKRMSTNNHISNNIDYSAIHIDSIEDAHFLRVIGNLKENEILWNNERVLSKMIK